MRRWPGHRTASQALYCLGCSPPTTQTSRAFQEPSEKQASSGSWSMLLVKLSSGDADCLGLNLVFPDLETPASMPGKASGDCCCSSPSGLAVFPPSASQQLFTQPEAGKAD
jgi:hypothetical protein